MPICLAFVAVPRCCAGWVLPQLSCWRLACPALHHAVQDWEMPAELAALRQYMDTFMSRDSWKNTYYSPEMVIAGWEAHGIKKLVPAQ